MKLLIGRCGAADVRGGWVQVGGRLTKYLYLNAVRLCAHTLYLLELKAIKVIDASARYV